MNFNHIGYLVKSIEKAKRDLINTIGVKEKSGIYYDREQDVYLCFLGHQGDDGIIELIQPGESNNKLTNLLKQKGDSIYHICYEVDDIEEEISKIKKNGGLLIKESKPAIAFNNRKVAFLFIRAGFIIELLESRKRGD